MCCDLSMFGPESASSQLEPLTTTVYYVQVGHTLM